MLITFITMGITFNGQVTINGDVEMYDNGSMKISNRAPLELDIDTLVRLIRANVADRGEQDALARDAHLLASADATVDVSRIKGAIESVGKFTKSLGRDVVIKGISAAVAEIIKRWM